LNVVLSNAHGTTLVPRETTYDCVFGVDRSEATIETVRIMAITDNDAAIGICHQYDKVILIPTNARMTPRPVCRYWNRSRMSARRKYRARNPKIAKAFDAKAMYCSFVTAKTAGTESTAKMTSVISTNTRTARSGVARRLPLTLVHSY